MTQGLTFAQQVGSNPDPIDPEPLPVEDRSDKALAHGDIGTQAKTFGLLSSGNTFSGGPRMAESRPW
jgi:hypothetical protein